MVLVFATVVAALVIARRLSWASGCFGWPPRQGLNGRLLVAALHVYPIKSCKAWSLQSADVGALGLAGDRRVMVVAAESGEALTQRERPEMCLIAASEAGGIFHVDAPAMPPLTFGIPTGEAMHVRAQLIDPSWRGIQASASRGLGANLRAYVIE
jgi:hypothetical protein